MGLGAITRYRPGKDITFVATAAITERQVVVLTGDYAVAPAGAGAAKVIGIATQTVALGDSLTISSGGVQRPLAVGAIAAGDRVATAANGGVATATTGNLIGTALAAAVDGAPVDIRFDV